MVETTTDLLEEVSIELRELRQRSSRSPEAAYAKLIGALSKTNAALAQAATDWGSGMGLQLQASLEDVVGQILEATRVVAASIGARTVEVTSGGWPPTVSVTFTSTKDD